MTVALRRLGGCAVSVYELIGWNTDSRYRDDDIRLHALLDVGNRLAKGLPA